MRKLLLPALLATPLVALAACGGGGGQPAAPHTAKTTAAVEKAAPAPTTPATDDVDRVKAKLEAEGFSVDREDAPTDGVRSDLTISLGGRNASPMTIGFYEKPARAAKDARAIAKVFDGNPGRGIVKTADDRVYWEAEERKLTGADHAKYERVVKLAASVA